MNDLTLYGAHISPYVRKTRLVLAFKQLDYQHVPVIPGQIEAVPEFKQNSPLGKIPLLKTGNQYLSDSSVITAYLQRCSPNPSLHPEDDYGFARALWFEEYADSHMVSVIGGHLFAEKILARVFFKREPNQAEIELAINEEIPQIFDYLSGELKGPYLLGEQITLADIAVCGLFVSMRHCSVECDAARWPTLAAYIERVHGLPFFAKIIAEEQAMLKALVA